MKTIKLFNHYHNGDIFYSRLITQNLKDLFNIEYYHPTPLSQFEDFKNVKEYNNSLLHSSDSTPLVFDTWVGQNNAEFLKDTLCSFYTGKKILINIFNKLGLSIPKDEDLIPYIDYNNLKNIDEVKNKLSNYDGFLRKILISNNNVQSGQSLNFDFDPIINTLSDMYPNYLFLITNPTSIKKENVIHIKDITGNEFDLLYISFISTKCDIIIGRASGPFCYCHVKENLLDKNKTFISLTHNEIEGVWFKESDAKQIWTNNYDNNHIVNLINNEINVWSQ
jgi:hypothetical protein